MKRGPELTFDDALLVCRAAGLTLAYDESAWPGKEKSNGQKKEAKETEVLSGDIEY
jgi:hypothetical protein